jgi:uncharacterized protein (TIGR03083 family)
VRAPGLSDEDPDVVGGQVLDAWDAFLDVASQADLSRPSRLPGWTGRDVCVHLGAWEERTPLSGLVESARAGGAGEAPDQDAENSALVAAHRDASDDEVLAALVRARDALEGFFESPLPAEIGRAPARSSLGPLPVLSLVHASTYELAVHALDLAPCGAPPPRAGLLDRGLASLLDVTGALAARSGIEARIAGVAPEGGWAFSAGAHGWHLERAHEVDGAGVRGSAADLLDASAGRAALPTLLLTRRIVVSQLPHWMRLAPIVNEVPGLPGGAALRAGVGGVGRLGSALSRLGRR